MIWLLVPLLVLLTLPLWLRDAFSHEVDWWLMWFTAAALASAALLAPSVWVGMGLAWLAIVPIWTYFGAIRKIVRPIEVPSNQVVTQLLVLAWVVLYLTAARSWTPDSLWWGAVVLWAWAVVNACVGILQRLGARVFGLIPVRGLEVIGLTQAPFLLSYLCGAGLVLTAALHEWWMIPFIPILIVAAYASRSFAAPIAAVPAAAVALVGPWGLLAGLAAPVLIRANSASWRVRREALQTVWRDVRAAHGWGRGLGACVVITTPPRPADDIPRTTRIWYSGPHNDWAHSLLECGPIPALCALAYLASHLWSPRAAPLGLVVYTAVWALAYFPVHVPLPTFVLAFAMGGLDA